MTRCLSRPGVARALPANGWSLLIPGSGGHRLPWTSMVFHRTSTVLCSMPAGAVQRLHVFASLCTACAGRPRWRSHRPLLFAATIQPCPCTWVPRLDLYPATRWVLVMVGLQIPVSRSAGTRTTLTFCHLKVCLFLVFCGCYVLTLTWLFVLGVGVQSTKHLGPGHPVR